MCWRQRVPLALAETPHGGLLIDAVFIDGVDVVLRGLQGPQLGAQVAVLAAIRGPGPSCKEGTRRRSDPPDVQTELGLSKACSDLGRGTETLKSAEHPTNGARRQQELKLISLSASPSRPALLPSLISEYG